MVEILISIILVILLYFDSKDYIEVFFNLRKKGIEIENAEIVGKTLRKGKGKHLIPLIKYNYNGQEIVTPLTCSYLTFFSNKSGKKMNIYIDKTNLKICISTSIFPIVSIFACLFLNILIILFFAFGNIPN